eukprot:122681-Prymnesium_polylepis.1
MCRFCPCAQRKSHECRATSSVLDDKEAELGSLCFAPQAFAFPAQMPSLDPPGSSGTHVCAHSVALNMSNVDLPLQLHYALFNGTGGYIVKPPEMLLAAPDNGASGAEGGLEAAEPD